RLADRRGRAQSRAPRPAVRLDPSPAAPVERRDRRDRGRAPGHAREGVVNSAGSRAELDLLAAARTALRAGLRVLPPKEDGTKAPDANEWTSKQQARATEAEVRAWYANGRTGLGIVCGAVSGGLELLEFDCRETWHEYQRLAEDAGLSGLLARVEDGY